MAETEDARYSHASLYHFSAFARREVISQFNNDVPDSSARCWYDEEKSAFMLTCSGTEGSAANGALHDIITRYIEANSEQADCAEIFRFAESDFDNLDIEHPHSLTSVLASLQSQPHSRDTVTLHSVIGESTSMRLFGLLEIGNGILERTLAPPNHGSTIEQGLTCRAAMWVSPKVKYIFNGRTGSPIASDQLAISGDILDFAQFVPITDSRPEAKEKFTKSRTWGFIKGGKEPSMRDFVAGEGTVIFDDEDSTVLNSVQDPNEIQPDWPSDARKLWKSSALSPVNTGDSDNEGSPNEGASDSSDDFDDLFKDVSKKEDGIAQLLPSSLAIAQQPSLRADNQLQTLGSGSQGQHTMTGQSQKSQLHSWGGPFANLDQRGLNSTAAAQAQYELENQSPRKVPNRTGITRRQHSRQLLGQPVIDSSAAMSTSNDSELRPEDARSTPATSFSEMEGLSICNHPGSQFTRETWVNNNVPKHVELGKLVDADPDEIVERLQVASTDPQAPKFTMRQKAMNKGKNRKKATANSSSPKINLPKPSPPPPPKKRQETSSHRDLPCETPITETRQNTALDKLLEQVASIHDVSKAKLRIDFGLILSRSSSGKGVYDASDMEKRFNREKDILQTNFLPRLTTSDSDARFMLGLVDGDKIHYRVEYEFQLKNSSGNLRVVSFDPKTKACDVWIPDVAMGKLFIHYPVRVWDAQAIIDKRVTDSTLAESVQAFLATLQTSEQPPSFLAKVGSNQFSIEKVCAKRIFEKAAGARAVLRVTEVQDLVISSVDLPLYNIEATAVPKEQMIEDYRLWWEASLYADKLDVPMADLQDLASGVMSEIDGVGYSNKGPWKRAEVASSPHTNTVSSEVPFW